MGSEDAFPPLGGTSKVSGGGAPKASILQAVTGPDTNGDKGSDLTEVLAQPPGPSTDDTPETAAELPSAPASTDDTAIPGTAPADKAAPPSASTSTTPSTSTSKPPAKRHPIQGGRDGPLGLAHPPPIEPPKPTPSSRADKGSWRTNPPNGAASTKKPMKKPAAPAPAPPPAPEPRVRKEVKVREGGMNDMSSLANRLRGLVLENQKADGGRERKKSGELGEGKAEAKA